MASYEPFLAKWRAEMAAGATSSASSTSASAASGGSSGDRIVCSSPNEFTIRHTLEDFINGGKTAEGLEVVRHVLANGCTRDGTNISGEEAINSAAVVDGDFASDGPVTCIYVCAYTNQLETINLLLANGADPEAPVTRYSSMSQAALAGNVDIMRLFAEHGCDVNIRDTRGITPLHFGAQKFASVQLLLELGADPTITGPVTGAFEQMQTLCVENPEISASLGVNHEAVRDRTQVTALDTAELVSKVTQDPDANRCYEALKAAFDATSAIRTSLLI